MHTKLTMFGPNGSCTTSEAVVRVTLDVLRDHDRLIGVETRIGQRCSGVNVPCDCLVCTYHRDGMLVVDFLDSDGTPSVFRVGGVGGAFAADAMPVKVRREVA